MGAEIPSISPANSSPAQATPAQRRFSLMCIVFHVPVRIKSRMKDEREIRLKTKDSQKSYESPQADICANPCPSVSLKQKREPKTCPRHIQGPKRRERVTTAAPQEDKQDFEEYVPQCLALWVVSLASFLDTSESDQIMQMPEVEGSSPPSPTLEALASLVHKNRLTWEMLQAGSGPTVPATNQVTWDYSCFLGYFLLCNNSDMNSVGRENGEWIL